MFDSLKNKFKNIFKKDAEPEREKEERPVETKPPEPPKAKPIEQPKAEPPKAKAAEPPKAKPEKEKTKKKVFDDDWDDDWDEELDDLIPEDEWEGDDVEDDEEPAPVKKPEPAPKPTPAPVRKEEPIPIKKEEPVKKEEPKPAPKPVAPTPVKKEEPVRWQNPVAPVKKEEPVKKQEPTPVAPAPITKPEPKAEPQKEVKLSWKDRWKLGKQEKAAAKEAEEEKKREDAANRTEGDLVSDKGKKIKERGLDEVLWELEIALMEADVALPVVEEIKNGVREDLLGRRHARGHELGEVVELSLKNAISKILKLNEFDFDKWIETREKPVVVMFVGINGTGKTTAIAKIAYRLMNQGKTVVLASSDTFRAGAIEQLTIHSERLGCKIVKHTSGADPAAVAYDAIEHARSKHKDVVLVDTAGRMQTNSNLMDEMKKIKKVAKPDLVMFVGDSLAGNDAVEQARAFDAAIGVDAIMLTKIDADSKGGAALSIAHTIGKPIAFVSNGQEYDQIVKFSSKWMMDRLFED
jgi:fused signal recognition particle receptor